jgi:uncharacterized protein (TIGR02147 family)
MNPTEEPAPALGRPVVYDCGSPVQFLNQLLKYYKSQGAFSIRQRTAKVGVCSQALISQILMGNRQLNRDNFPAVASVFKLTPTEIRFIDQMLLPSLSTPNEASSGEREVNKVRQSKNHLLSDWLHPYVKDLVHIRGFRAEPEILFRILKGIAPVSKIQRSVDFLLREGFWRKNTIGQVIPEEAAVTTTNEIPSEKIRAFHKKALEIAHEGISNLPVNQRKASTILISVDEQGKDELRTLVDSFQQQLLQFIEKHPEGKDALMQVVIHLTPIGERIRD